MTSDERRLLRLLGLALLFEGYGRSLLGVALAPIGVDLGASGAALSRAMAVVTAGALGAMALGSLADRHGRRRVLLGCVLGYSLLGAGTASAGTLGALVVWQAGARLFHEGALTVATITCAEEVAAERRGAAQGILGLVNNLGAGLVAFLFGAAGGTPGGWRLLALVAAAPLAVLPLLRRSLPESRRWRAVQHEPPVAASRYRGRLATAFALVFLAGAHDVAGFAFTSWLPMAEHGWSAPATSAMVIVAGACGLPGWWRGGRLADGAGRRPTAAAFLVGLSAAEAIFFLAGPRWLWPAFAAMVFCQGGKTAVLRAWAAELFPTRVRGTVAARLSVGTTLGGMAGLTLVGTLPHPGGHIGPAVALVALAGPLAACLTTLLPETRGHPLDEITPHAA